mmetsp:Transcript_24/g.78  ORF Transcript_24/g.78 Transcript_24/m.78 type:complete len:273 (+) Transcript_24:88-906(+)
MCCGFAFQYPDAPWRSFFAKPGGLLGGLGRCSPQAYLITRIVFFFVWLACVIWSSISWVEVEGRGYGFWWIKLTHWAAIIELVYLGFGAFSTYQAIYSPVVDGKDEDAPLFATVTWFLGSVIWVASLMVVVIYWAAVFEPGPGKPTAIQILTHGGNFILVWEDNLLSRLPYRWYQIYAPALFSVVYVAFSKVYYLAGGTDWNGAHYIYKIIDWSDPVAAWKVVAGLLFVGLPSFFGLFLLVVAIRTCCFKQAQERVGAEHGAQGQHSLLQVA